MGDMLTARTAGSAHNIDAAHIADTAVCAAVDGMLDAGEPATLLVSGAPRSGKTTLAVHSTLRAMQRLGETAAVMIVPNRRVADVYSDEIIRTLGSSTRMRPATTLNALAFQILDDARERAGRSHPRLINGAEQDALLRHVIAVHVKHWREGESGSCETCRLLAAYFEDAATPADVKAAELNGQENQRPLDWATIVLDAASDADADWNVENIAANVNADFVAQARDMLARLDEIGALLRLNGNLDEQGDAVDWIRRVACTQVESEGPAGVRLSLQWRLALALRHEYIDLIGERYHGEYRLDPSYLPLAAMHALRDGDGDDDLPTVLIVDDVQDLTLSGLAFLSALRARGARLLLIGNPDEALQSFRGSYPEYLFERFLDPNGVFAATQLRLPAPTPDPVTYRDIVASRVSLSIATPEHSDEALPNRPGKLPAVAGSASLQPLEADDARIHDGSLQGRLYRNATAELDDIVWQITTNYLDDDATNWNDMAVICHDNADVRRFGEALRSNNIPVRYSSVTRALADEPFVRGLFALIELAQLRNARLETRSMTLASAAKYVRSRVQQIADSLLIDPANTPSMNLTQQVKHKHKPTRPLRLDTVNAAMLSLEALAKVTKTDVEQPPEPAETAEESSGFTMHFDVDTGNGTDDAATDQTSALADLERQWNALADAVRKAHAERERESAIVIDDSLLDDTEKTGDDLPFGTDALYLLLAQGDDDTLLTVLEHLCGTADDDTQGFIRLWQVVGALAASLRTLPSQAPQFALDAAWQATNVAPAWRAEAIFDSPAGRAANDRLYVAMRLFGYAQSYTQSEENAPTINAFIDQVRQLQIEADSLAKTAPVDQAVTLTTPAGTSGRAWKQVWIPSVQQGVWPNLAARNTMFGGEDLIDLIMHGVAREEEDRQGNRQLEQVLANEQKSWLVALTRASGQVFVSASVNDDMTPSDFLYAYLPEYFDRTQQSVEQTADSDGTERRYLYGDESLDASIRGVIALARMTLMHASETSGEFNDAVAALSELASHGIAQADPRNWPFMQDAPGSASVASASKRSAASVQHHRAHSSQSAIAAAHTQPADPFAQNRQQVINLLPSQVDNLWACAVCSRMEREFSGPTPSGVAQNFGTLVHGAAQYATAHHWDLPSVYEGFFPLPESGEHTGEWCDEVVRVLTLKMFNEYYAPNRMDPQSIQDASERYQAYQRDAEAQSMLLHVAHYFVYSNEPGYLGDDSCELQQSFAEQTFRGRFTLADITDAYNRGEADEYKVSVDEMRAILGTLMQGWPLDLADDQIIQLTGSIDRIEERAMPEGGTAWRIIDYKTGYSHKMGEQFNDLQLVCYQLGVAFNTDREPNNIVSSIPGISRSGLFYVKDQAAPAGTRTRVESYHQPALIVDGAITRMPFIARPSVRKLEKLFDASNVPQETPEGVRDEVWQHLLASSNEMTLWALSMISRVFYAAAASRAQTIIAHPTAAHMQHCTHGPICPACAEEMATVFETQLGTAEQAQ